MQQIIPSAIYDVIIFVYIPVRVPLLSTSSGYIRITGRYRYLLYTGPGRYRVVASLPLRVPRIITSSGARLLVLYTSSFYLHGCTAYEYSYTDDD